VDIGASSGGGAGSLGQLGEGSPPSYSASPIAVHGLAGAKAVSAGNQYTCAILADSTVACWGDNSHGAIANGTYAPVVVEGI
jgi:alpha-tubulin suppressor-like RCC1 family protein